MNKELLKDFAVIVVGVVVGLVVGKLLSVGLSKLKVPIAASDPEPRPL